MKGYVCMFDDYLGNDSEEESNDEDFNPNAKVTILFKTQSGPEKKTLNADQKFKIFI